MAGNQESATGAGRRAALRAAEALSGGRQLRPYDNSAGLYEFRQRWIHFSLGLADLCTNSSLAGQAPEVLHPEQLPLPRAAASLAVDRPISERRLWHITARDSASRTRAGCCYNHASRWEEPCVHIWLRILRAALRPGVQATRHRQVPLYLGTGPNLASCYSGLDDSGTDALRG